MIKKNLRLIIAIILIAPLTLAQVYKLYNKPSKNNTSVNGVQTQTKNKEQFSVVKIIDGDTIDVLISNKVVKVRILGINTPETVDPRKAVQCFGKEASDKAKSLLKNQRVYLEADSTQANRDKYNRLLRYVFLTDGTDFGLQMIREGYAYEYTYDAPYKFQKEYRAAQKTAEYSKVGLWSDATCNGKL